MSTQIKTFVFDLGGVLFEKGTNNIVEQLYREKGYDKKTMERVLIAPQMRRKAVKGEISDEEYWRWVKEEIPAEYDVEYIRKAYYDSFYLNDEIFDLLKSIKSQGYRCVIFSGNMRTRIDYLENKYGFSKYFDEAVYSFDTGHNKPEDAFFDDLKKVLGCKPEEAVLLDDEGKIIDAAKAHGFKTAHYPNKNYGILMEQLRTVGTI
jgi:putative hydrolase of the HAD superfamily